MSEICKIYILRDLLETEYHSSVNVDAYSKSVLEIKKFVISILFWDFFLGGGGGPPILDTYEHDRLDKLHSALAVTRLKTLPFRNFVGGQ